MSRKPAVIGYDIANKKSAYQVRKLLTGHRLNGQKSIAECWLSEREAQELFLMLIPYIDAERDSLVIAWLDSQRTVLAAHGGVLHSFRSMQFPSPKRVHK